MIAIHNLWRDPKFSIPTTDVPHFAPKYVYKLKKSEITLLNVKFDNNWFRFPLNLIPKTELWELSSSCASFKSGLANARPAGHKWPTIPFWMPLQIILNNKAGIGQNIGPIDKVYCNTKMSPQVLKYVLEGSSTYLGVDNLALQSFLVNLAVLFNLQYIGTLGIWRPHTCSWLCT